MLAVGKRTSGEYRNVVLESCIAGGAIVSRIRTIQRDDSPSGRPAQDVEDIDGSP